MSFEEIMNQQRVSKKSVDEVRMNYLCDIDVEVCNYVVSQVPYIDIKPVISGRRITVDELVQKSLCEMKVFDDDIYSRACSLTPKVPIRTQSNNIDQFSTGVSYVIYNDGSVRSDSGMIYAYVIPEHLFELSIYHFGHEQIHGLKETNYKEYVNNITLGEVVPIFYELLVYSPDEVLKRELLKFRMSSILDIKEEYLLFNDLFLESSFDKLIYGENEKINEQTSLYEYCRSKMGCYLNSFYYSLILYSMYKETPGKILTLVSKVLKHEMTTLQLLIYLDIYGDIKGETFEKEMGKIRKLLI